MAGPSSSSDGPVPVLDEREVEFLERLGLGETLEQIATAWGIGPSGARSFAERLRKKMGVKTNPHAVFIAVQLRILDPSRRHGDHAGFAAHRYRGEEPCEACWDGERAYRRALRAARKTRTS